MDFKLEDLFDLEAARIADAELAAEEEAEKQLHQPCSDLPGQLTMQEDNENVYDSIYSDNLQRIHALEMIQDRIDFIENLHEYYSDKNCDEYKNDLHELNSLKDSLLFHS